MTEQESAPPGALDGASPAQSVTPEPKKSARLAEKRKLKEELPTTSEHADYYFMPLTAKCRSASPSNLRVSPLFQNISRSTLGSKLKRHSHSPQGSSSSTAKLPQLSSLWRYHQGPKKNSLLQMEGQAATLTCGKPTYYWQANKDGESGRSGSHKFVHETIQTDATNRKKRDSEIGSRFVYWNTREGTLLIFPRDTDTQFQKHNPPLQVSPTTAAARCGVAGCLNFKKYSCSTTNTPLCSLECYKHLKNTS